MPSIDQQGFERIGWSLQILRTSKTSLFSLHFSFGSFMFQSIQSFGSLRVLLVCRVDLLPFPLALSASDCKKVERAAISSMVLAFFIGYQPLPLLVPVNLCLIPYQLLSYFSVSLDRLINFLFGPALIYPNLPGDLDLHHQESFTSSLKSFLSSLTLSPQELFGGKISKREKLLPLVTVKSPSKTQSYIDFTFSERDLIEQKEHLNSYMALERIYADKVHPGRVTFLEAGSGVAKTKTIISFARKHYTLFFQATSESPDLQCLDEFLALSQIQKSYKVLLLLEDWRWL
jgi:hypothetical protein